MPAPRTGTLIVLGLAIVGVAVAVSMLAPWGTSTPVVTQTRAAGAAGVTSRHSSATTDSGDTFSVSLSEEGTWVHVVGEVVSPGLYQVTDGARVVDAIMAAGGLTPRADECAINLARPLNDGEQIVVPTRVGDATQCGVSTATGANGGGSGAPISLSGADLATLDSLPGIGPTLAQRIIDWRSAHGGFTSVDQLNEVSGIGDKLFATLAPLLTP